jgi:hypothetical protein
MTVIDNLDKMLHRIPINSQRDSRNRESRSKNCKCVFDGLVPVYTNIHGF